MSTKTFIRDLKALLEGKTVVTVEPPAGLEHVVRITTADGNTFEIGGSGDFGNWIAETKNNSDPYYSDLTTFFSEYYSYCYRFDVSLGEPTILWKDDVMTLIGPERKEFKLDIARLSTFEKRVTDQNVEVIKFAASLGDAWRGCLSRHAYDTDYPELDELKAESKKIMDELYAAKAH